MNARAGCGRADRRGSRTMSRWCRRSAMASRSPERCCRSRAARACWCWKTITPRRCSNGSARADAQGFTVETVAQPADGDWTSAVLEAIERPGAAPLSLASISSVHWSDGGLLDIQKIRDALRRHGAALLVDATHSVGVIATDVKTLDPDFLIFPTYKWVLVLMAAPSSMSPNVTRTACRSSRPLSGAATSRPRTRSTSPNALSPRRTPLRHGRARSFHLDGDGRDRNGDDGELGRGRGRWRLSALTRRISDGLADSNALRPDERFRAPHILCLRFPSVLGG